jgi:hypothetical protein
MGAAALLDFLIFLLKIIYYPTKSNGSDLLKLFTFYLSSKA